MIQILLHVQNRKDVILVKKINQEQKIILKAGQIYEDQNRQNHMGQDQTTKNLSSKRDEYVAYLDII